MERTNSEVLPEQHERAWRHYRNYFEDLDRPQGMEVGGLTREEFARALSDPETIVIDSSDIPAIPLATSLDNLQWYNKHYFQKVAETVGLPAETPLIYYDHLSALFQRDPEQYLGRLEPLFRKLATRQGLLLFDTLDAEAEITLAELDHMFQSLNLGYNDVLQAVDPEARHYNFAARVTLQNAEDIRSPHLDFYQISEQAVGSSDQSDSTTSVEPTLNQEDIENIWTFYKAAFDELTVVDPMIASSPYQEFEQLLQDPRVVKIVERIDSTVTSLCMFGPVQLFEWANQLYYSRTFPEEYQNDLVFFFPGVIRNPNSRGDGRRVMASMGRLLATAGIETSVISFVCDKISRKPVSVMGTWALNRSGVVTDLRQPKSQRIFHAVRLF